MAGTARTLHLADLDDATLQRILSFLHPHPDLFRVAASCRRLRDLALDRRSWLVVCHTPQEPAVGIPRQYRKTFLTLQDAISASRPGDTIVIAPGEPHRVCGVVVPWPLHIMGGGTSPEQTLLLCPRGGGTALDFRHIPLDATRRASARLANLTVLSRLGSCVTHRRGRLAIEGCWLRCESEGLDHLVSPIATLATSGPAAAPAPSPLPAAAANLREVAGQGVLMGQPGGHERGQQERENPLKRGLRCEHGVQQQQGKEEGAGAGGQEWEAAAAAGPGLLAVVESKITGGGVAIRTQGTGSLRSVRVIYESSATLFWFDVDSSIPGTPQQQQQPPLPQQSHPPAGGAAEEAGRRAGGSSWSATASRKRGLHGGSGSAGEAQGLLPQGIGSAGANVGAVKRPRHAAPAGDLQSSRGAAPASTRSSGDVAMAGAHSMAPSTPVQALPAWMQRPPFDPLAFQQRVHSQMVGRQQLQEGHSGRQPQPQPYHGREQCGEQLQRQGGADVVCCGGPGVPGVESERLAEELLDKKAEQWSRHHAAALAGASREDEVG
ncbi:hypothetical protein N2152v2_006607 [Parachlorella kessleri]